MPTKILYTKYLDTVLPYIRDKYISQPIIDCFTLSVFVFLNKFHNFFKYLNRIYVAITSK